MVVRLKTYLVFLVAVVVGVSGCLHGEPLLDSANPEPESADGASDDSGGNGSEPGVLNTCGPTYAPAIPVTQKMGNEDLWFQLFQFPGVDGEGGVFVSWRLASNFFEPDTWVFGGRIWDSSDEVKGTIHFETAVADCVYLGHAPQGFWYFMEAGAGAWVEDSECSIVTHWPDELDGSLMYSMVDAGNQTHGPFPWRMNYCPDDGVEHRVESLIRGGGRSSWCIECVVPEPGGLE